MQFHREENRKIRAHEEKFKDMVARWDVKTKDSPFRVNQLDQEERRLNARANREYNKSVEDYRNETIDNMIGTRRFDVYNKDTAHLVNDNKVKLALALRKQVDDNAIVKRERSTLDQMIDIQYSEMKQKFPAVEEFQSIVIVNHNSSPFRKGKQGLNCGLSFSSSTSRGTGSNVLNRTMTRGGSSKQSTMSIRSGNNSASGSHSTVDKTLSHDASCASLESGSGSIYRPPPGNAAELFSQELDARFEGFDKFSET